MTELKIAERLKELRKEADLTQEQAGKKLYVCGNTCSNYERGERVPGIDFVVNAAEFFGVSLDYLVGLSDDREDEE